MAKILINRENASIKILDRKRLKIIQTESFKLYYWGNIYTKDLFSEIKPDSNIFNHIEGDISGVIQFKDSFLIFKSFPGIIPLYFKKNSKNIFIGDLLDDFENPEINNKNTINNIFDYKKIKKTETFFKKVNRFLPGYIYSSIDNSFLFKDKCFDFPVNKKNFKELLKNSLDNRINNVKSSLLLSEGMDSGFLNSIIDNQVKRSSIIFDENSRKIIEDRVLDKNHEFFCGEQIKDHFKEIKINTVNYFFEPSAYVFEMILKKLEKEGIKQVIFGIGGDEIHGVDYFLEIFFDHLFNFRLKEVIKNFSYFKRIKQLNLNRFNKSFTKYRIKDLLDSAMYNLNLEMIYSMCVKYNIIPVFPYYSRGILRYVFNTPIYEIAEINKNRAKARKLSRKFFKDRCIKVSFKKMQQYFEINSTINYNKYVQELSRKLWQENYEKRRKKN